MFEDQFTVTPRRSLADFTDPGYTTDRRLRVCIITEEIYGPIRNGGIATTYFYLASMLASEGHDVTVLYLRGNHSENGPIEQWVKFYQERKIDFVSLSESEIPQDSVEEFRLWKYAAVYYWLRRNNRFDVVHTSEWRGGAYFTLLAKRLGGIFDKTLFIVKSSSPWIWNRHYMNELLFNKDQVIFMHGEKLCIEMADIVVGGSAHLLSFMESFGYKLDPDRIFVQPNIVDFSHIKISDSRENITSGERIPVDEWVFFGRLEMRKGLHLFCDALDELSVKNKLPGKITFMGKQGRGFPRYPGVPGKDYINSRSEKWKCEISVYCDKHQNEAIQYLVSKPVLAVMPSIIENSTMAVYEALIYKIPMIATGVGGTPELIREDQKYDLLCQPTARDLARKLERVFDQGALVGEAPFSPEGNIETWKAFHRWMTNRLDQNSIDEIHDLLIQKETSSNCSDNKVRISLCPVITSNTDVEELVAGLRQYRDALTGNDEILIGVTGKNCNDTKNSIQKELLEENMDIQVLTADSTGTSTGACLNCLCEETSGDWIILFHAGEVTLATGLFSILRQQNRTHSFGLLTWASRNRSNEKINIPMAENATLFLTQPEILGGPELAVSRKYWNNHRFLEMADISNPELEAIARASSKMAHCVLPEILTERKSAPRFPAHLPYYLRKPFTEKLPFGMRVLLSLRRLEPSYPEDGLIFGNLYLKLTALVRKYRNLKYRLRGGDHHFRK